MWKKFKEICFYIFLGICGFWIIGGTILSGVLVKQTFFPSKEQQEAVNVSLPPELFIEYVAQSSYEFEREGDVCTLRLKKHK